MALKFRRQRDNQLTHKNERLDRRSKAYDARTKVEPVDDHSEKIR